MEKCPRALRPHVAFLHEDVRTQEGPQRRNTVVQKFLDGRFARTFRREDVLRHVVLPALPPLPVAYDSPAADYCSEILAWTLKLLGDDESDALLPLIGRLPVATHGGWRAMNTAVFGSGWPGRLGDQVRALVDELPDEARKATAPDRSNSADRLSLGIRCGGSRARCSSGPACSMDFVYNPLRQTRFEHVAGLPGISRMTHRKTRRGGRGTTGAARRRTRLCLNS